MMSKSLPYKERQDKMLQISEMQITYFNIWHVKPDVPYNAKK